MEKVTTKSNKATLIAAALIITGATAIFGTYASEEQFTPNNQNRPAFAQQRMELTDEQKAVMEKARELFQAGDLEGAKAILDEAGIKPPRGHRNKGQFMKNLTEEQKAALEEAKELFEAGDKEGGMAILEEAGIKFPRKSNRNAKIIENFTDEQREMFKEAQELMRAGDREAAKAIFDELGLKKPKPRHPKCICPSDNETE